MKFVVTGASGFIGRALLRSLQSQRHEIVVVVRSSDVRPQLSTDRNISYVNGQDINEMKLSFEGATAVIHLATCFRGNHTPTDIDEMIESNVGLTTRVFEASHLAGVTRFIYTESIAQHANDAEYSPFSLYAALKQCGSDIIRYYVHSGGSAVFLTIPDTLGPQDTRGKLISQLMAAANDQGVLKMSPGDQLVDFVYIDDVVKALHVSIERVSQLQQGDVIQRRISSQRRTTLRQFVESVEDCLDKSIRVLWGERPYRPGEFFDLPNWPPLLEDWSSNTDLTDAIRKSISA
jgi:nucleoside-diphosphate-sugar epimerase